MPKTFATALFPFLALAAACSSSTAPAEPEFPGDPVVATALVVDGPPPPEGTDVVLFCREGPGNQGNNGQSPASDTCPILEWGEFTYWIFTGASNSSTMTIAAYDSEGVLRHTVSEFGARYAWAAEVDAEGETVTYFGQWGSGFDEGRMVTFTFDQLRF